jgi:hypothetical protein
MAYEGTRYWTHGAEKTHHRKCAVGVVEKLLSLITFFAALHVSLVVASIEPIDVKMEGGEQRKDETLFSRNAGMGSPTDDAAV